MEWIDTDEIRKKARAKLAEVISSMPIVRAIRGEDELPSREGLARTLLNIKPFDPNVSEGEFGNMLNAMNPIGMLGKIVYHGSPHKFDKFDASKIGTGEGAQAYGHGVYLADSEGVAKTYTSVNQPAYLNAGVRAIVDDVMKEAAEKGLKGREARLWANHEITRLAMERPEYARRQWFDAANNIDDILDKPVGALYKADLPDEWIPKMLDWDKPIAQQPPEVVDAVRVMLKEQKYLGPNDNGPRQFNSALKAWRNEHGGMADGDSGQMVMQWLGKSGSPDEAAAKLKALGIPGIKYLDGGSRGKGQGTYNYVVFPGLEDQVKILERNGVKLP